MASYGWSQAPESRPSNSFQPDLTQALAPMTKLFRICLPLTLTAALAGCIPADPFVSALRDGFVEEFGAACSFNQQCLADLSAHTEACFDRDLAVEAIGHGDSPEARRLHVSHIRKFHECVATKSGTDHWAGQDMADVILG